MKEIITIALGKTGCSINTALWEIYRREHEVELDGTLFLDASPGGGDFFFDSVFIETNEGKHIPRVVLIDSEIQTLNQIKYGPHRNLFNSSYFLGGNYGPKTSVYKDHSDNGSGLIPKNFEGTVRSIFEACSLVEGFNILMDVSEGYPSSIISDLMKKLADNYEKKPKITFSVVPSSQPDTLYTYSNALVGLNSLHKQSDMTCFYDYDQLYELLINKIGMDNPCNIDFDLLIAQTVASTTSGIRLDGTATSAMKSIINGIVPKKNMNLIIPSFAPLGYLDAGIREQQSVSDITLDGFSKSYGMVGLNYSQPKIILAAGIFYRGSVLDYDVTLAIEKLKQSKSLFQFSDYSPAPFMTFVTSKPICTIPGTFWSKEMRSACVMQNSDVITAMLERIQRENNQLAELNTKYKEQTKDIIEVSQNELKEVVSSYEEGFNQNNIS